MYTRTPDDLWIIDEHPNDPNILILAGFSGHGFKAGPLVGKVRFIICIEKIAT